MNIIGFAAIIPLAFVTSLAAVTAQRHSVWVDRTGNRVYMRILNRSVSHYGTVSHSLDAPTTVRFSYEPSALGDTFGGAWKGTVISPGEPVLNIAMPWIPSIEEFALLLQPALMANPGLPAAELSQRAIEDPSNIVHLQAESVGKNRQPW